MSLRQLFLLDCKHDKLPRHLHSNPLQKHPHTWLAELRASSWKLHSSSSHTHMHLNVLLPLVQVCARSLLHGSAIARSLAQLNSSVFDPDWHPSFIVYAHIYDSCSSSSPTFSTCSSSLPSPCTSTLISDPSGSPCSSFSTIATNSTMECLAA